ncbi:hypothetical protein GCM10027614_66380 [Micromonospora vulcania]
MHFSLLNIALPLWIAGHTRAPAWMISALMLINTVLVVLLQVRARAPPPCPEPPEPPAVPASPSRWPAYSSLSAAHCLRWARSVCSPAVRWHT